MKIEDIIKSCENHSLRPPIRKLFRLIKELLITYSNFLLVVATFLLVVVTYNYVELTKETLDTTKETLRTMKEQTDIIRKDYQARTEPEIIFSDPVREGDITRLRVKNTGFRAERVQVDMIVFYDEVPEDKLGKIYIFKGETRFMAEEIMRLGEDQGFNVTTTGIDYDSSKAVSLLIVVKYFSPLIDTSKVEAFYYVWKSILNGWQPLLELDSRLFVCKAIRKELLKNIITTGQSQEFLNSEECKGLRNF